MSECEVELKVEAESPPAEMQSTSACTESIGTENPLHCMDSVYAEIESIPAMKGEKQQKSKEEGDNEEQEEEQNHLELEINMEQNMLGMGLSAMGLIGEERSAEEELDGQYDFAIAFETPQTMDEDTPEQMEDKAMTNKRAEESQAAVIEGLKKAHLEYRGPRKSASGELSFIVIRGTNLRMMHAAEETKTRVDCNPDGGPKVGGKSFPARMKADCFNKGLETNRSAVFTIENYKKGHYAQKVGEEMKGSCTEEGYQFASASRCALMDSVIQSRVTKKDSEMSGAGINMDRWRFEGRISIFTPLHDLEELDALKDRWMGSLWRWWWDGTAGHIPAPDPKANRKELLDQINDYFGNQIGFYFAFLGYYTYCLFPLAAFSIPISIGQYIIRDVHPFMLLWTTMISLWTAVFFKFWMRKTNELRYNWNIDDQHELLGYHTKAKPEFVVANACCQGAENSSGFYADDKWVSLAEYEQILPLKFESKPERWAAKFQKPLDGAKGGIFCKPHFKDRRRCLTINHGITFVCVMLLLAVSLLLFVMKFKMKTNMGGTWGGGLGALADGASIQLFNQIYKVFAVKLNDWENHRTHEKYDNALIMKVFCFEFINTYISLIYVAVAKPMMESYRDFEMWPAKISDYCFRHENDPRINDEHQYCYSELQVSYIGILAAKLIADATVDMAVPYFKMQLRQWQTHGKIQDTTASRAEQMSIENQLLMESYDTSLWDFNQLILTFGLIVMFGTCWPFGVCVIGLYLMVQNGVDGFKLCQTQQRPLRKACNNIGTWRYIIQLIGIFGIITNTTILVYTMDWFGRNGHYISGEKGSWTAESKFKAFMLIEHVLVSIYLGILLGVGEEPTSLQEKMALDMFELENYSYDQTVEPEQTQLTRGDSTLSRQDNIDM